jgi:crossover junction endodeoxyribonuclease RusA
MTYKKLYITTIIDMIPFEFIVEGPPMSQQTRRREKLRAWKQKIRRTAEEHWPSDSLPSVDQLSIRITYYFEDVSPDVDNIGKPIQDALIGLVYNDDSQITDIIARKRDINGAYRVRGLSSALAQGFMLNRDFLHIRIELSTNMEEL